MRTNRVIAMAMQASEVPRAVAAATSTASALGLRVDETIVLHLSNRLALRLLPSDVLARVALATHEAAELEVEVAARLAATDGPVALLDPRVAPRVYERDGFAVALWTYYEPEPARELSPADYADALSRLHVGMQHVDASPRRTSRIASRKLSDSLETATGLRRLARRTVTFS